MVSGVRHAATRLKRRRFLGACAAMAGAMLLASCSGGNLPSFPRGQQPAQPPQQGAAANAFGAGPVRVALLLPLSANGNAGSTGQVLRNVSELAIAEIPNAAITVMPFDTKGTPQGARDAANLAAQSGSSLIIGPLFSNEVTAVGQVAGSSNIPVIAFSSDPNAAGGPVHLLSFLAESDVNRVVFHAAQNGRKAFGALVPENAYGLMVEGALRRAASRNGGQLIAVERYQPDVNSITAASAKITALASGSNPRINALMIPDGAAAVPHIVQALQSGGVDFNKVKLLGTGQWDDPAVLQIPQLQGAWFAAPDPAGFNELASRYQNRYGAQPPRIASLAYDATSLAAALASIDSNNPYPPGRLENKDGFQGTDGIFRFDSQGRSERGLAVLEVQPPGRRVASPAPKTFRGSGF
ncbi:MAG: penicillin-binding protein activator [Rhodobiaceae bacterium]|nr:penicillin-binding protein activator [Rhodobiaceae bacterium]MCC0049245.1 penicillin-binding protein activator [Rhodobiaceae bacterium]